MYSQSRGASDVAASLELRGYTRIGGVMEFSIYNKDTQESEWVRANESMGEYKIDHFDPETNSLVVRHNNRIGYVSLQASQIGRYIPPAPREKPTSAPPGQSNRQRDRIAGTGSNQEGAPSNSRTPTGSSSGSQPQTASRSRDSGNQPQQFASGLPRQGTPPPPETSEPTPPDDRGENNDSDDSNDSDGWESTGSPPPLPPTAPPNYSPED